MINHPYGFTRRQAIRSLMGGSLLLPGVISELLAADAARGLDADPLAPKEPHFQPKAKRVIFLYMSGFGSSVSTCDTPPLM